MSKAKTAKERVLEVYPDAEVKWELGASDMLFCIKDYDGTELSTYACSEPSAWQSALTRITNNKTKSND